MRPNILIELFSLSTKLSGMVIEELSEAIEEQNVRVDTVEDYDTRVYYHFSYPALGALTESSDAQLAGTLIIDRLKANYEVIMKFDILESISEPISYAPLYTKDFDEVLRYIALVNENIDEVMYKLLPKRAFYTTFSEDAYTTKTGHNYRKLSPAAQSYLTGILRQYNESGTTTFNIDEADQGVIHELVMTAYVMRRGNIVELDPTMADSLRSVTAL